MLKKMVFALVPVAAFCAVQMSASESSAQVVSRFAVHSTGARQPNPLDALDLHNGLNRDSDSDAASSIYDWLRRRRRWRRWRRYL